MIDFRTEPSAYRHWRLSFAGPVATLAMDVDENGGLAPGYELKLNSYDLGVDIELNDAVNRLRFEHPEVKCVIVTSGKERVFCAGANIRMLGLSSHPFKVNFCKFTNETRNAIEDATLNSDQYYMTAIGGACAGGGYELALATDYIMMADDGSTSVSLPEVALLGVLPGTGGLTRLVDKRRVRRDRADFFCTTEEGVRGKRAVEWQLVDEVVPRSQLLESASRRALEFAARSSGIGESARNIARPARARGRRAAGQVCAPDDRDRSRQFHRDVHGRGSNEAGAAQRRRRSLARRGFLAVGDCARTRRRDPASALQRGNDPHVDLSHARRLGAGEVARRVPRRERRRLADA